MQLTIRPARPDEASAIAALVEESYQHYVPRIGLRPAPMDADYDADVMSQRVWVAEHDGAVSGVIVIGVEDGHLLVDNVAVSPPYQGQGIGSRLLDLAEDQARSAGITEIRLFTHEKMHENIAYYGRRGYVETHRQQENGFSRVFFSKYLT